MCFNKLKKQERTKNFLVTITLQNNWLGYFLSRRPIPDFLKILLDQFIAEIMQV